MKNLIRVAVLVLSMLAAIASLAVAQEDQSIAAFAAGDSRFDTLAAAVVAAGLSATLAGGEWTVFAPTDEAFAQAGLTPETVGELSAEELRGIVLYHALPLAVSTARAKTMLGDVTMANGSLAGLKWFDGSLWINDDVRVIERDIITANGVVHAVNAVVTPPWPRSQAPVAIAEAASPGDEPETAAGEFVEVPLTELEPATAEDTIGLSEDALAGTIVGILAADNRFDTISAAIEAAGLQETLATGTWTFFAPNDPAFASLGLRPNNIGEAFSQEELANLVLYHAWPEEASMDKARILLGDVIMGNGQLAGLKWFRNTVWVNDEARVVVKDIPASNGMIHGVNSVITGPWPRVPAEEMPAPEAFD